MQCKVDMVLHLTWLSWQPIAYFKSRTLTTGQDGGERVYFKMRVNVHVLYRENYGSFTSRQLSKPTHSAHRMAHSGDRQHPWGKHVTLSALCVCACVRACMRACMHVCVHVCVCACMCVCVCMCVCPF